MTLPVLYAIVDYQTANEKGWEVCDLAREYLAGGAKLVQLRAPNVASRDYLGWCDRVVQDAADYDAQVIVNDRADIAAIAGAAGVHLGQFDLEPTDVRRRLSSRLLVGLSVHTPKQLEESVNAPLDYVAVGPIYDTSTKKTGYEPVGTKLVASASRMNPSRPVVGIGGINLERAMEVRRAGATSVAVISDLLEGNRPARRVSDYVKALEESS
jgi:thiamine-phosphate pyrophosphorylase